MDCPPLEDGMGNGIETQNVFHFDQKKTALAACRALYAVIVLRYYCIQGNERKFSSIPKRV
jgi:hypothetical protein